MLQREGLVEASRNRRVRVSDLSIRDMEDLYCARIPLEALAVRQTIRTLDDAGRAELEGLYAQMAFFAAREDYEGFTILATPYKEGGQYQLCGVISKQIDGQRREHRFIRADRFASMDDAVEMTLMKARQIIDQQGERIFREA